MDPYGGLAVVQIDRGATDKEVKKAYRQLSLIYHPDKNPDPAAAKYFAESITKAYQALTGALLTFLHFCWRSLHAQKILSWAPWNKLQLVVILQVTRWQPRCNQHN